MTTQFTASMEAAALEGIASNGAFSIHDRLRAALQVIEHLRTRVPLDEKSELEKLRREIDRLKQFEEIVKNLSPIVHNMVNEAWKESHRG